MLLAKTLLRDWRKLAVVAFALFVVGMSIPSLLVSAQGSTLAIVFSTADHLQPMLEAHYSPYILIHTGEFNYTTFENATRALLEVYRNLSIIQVHDERGAVSRWGTGIAVRALVYYRLPLLSECNVVPVAPPGGAAPQPTAGPEVGIVVEEEYTTPPAVVGPGGERLFTLKSGLLTINVHERDESGNTTRIYVCEPYTASFSVYAILDDPQGPPFKVVAGRPPQPGSNPLEVMVLDRFAKLLGWSVGGTYELLGARVRVVGVYSYTSGFVATPTPAIVVNGFDDLKKLMEAFGSEASRYTPPAGAWIASMTFAQSIVYDIALDVGEYPEGAEGLAVLANAAAWAGEDAVLRYANASAPALSGVRRMLEAGGPQAEEGLETARRGLALTLVTSAAEDIDLIRYGFVSDEFMASVRPGRKSVEEALSYLARVIVAYENAIDPRYRGPVGGNAYAFLKITPDATVPVEVWPEKPVEATPARGPASILLGVHLWVDEAPFTALASGATANPVIIFGMIVVVLVLIAVGLKASTEALTMVLSDLRPYIALIIARGARTSSVRKSYMSVVVGAAALMGVAGVLATAYLLVSVLNALIARGVLDRWMVVGSPLYWASGVGGAALVGTLVSWRTLKVIREIQPIEALRPVESLRAAHKRRARLNALLAALGVLTVAVGLLVKNPDDLLDRLSSQSPALAAIAFITLLLAFMFSPFAPAVLSYQASEYLQASTRLYTAIARRLAALAGPLRAPVEESTGRMRERLAAALASTIMASGVAVGAALAAGSTADLAVTLEKLYVLGEADLDVVSGFAGSVGLFNLLAAFALAVAVVVLYTSIASTFRLIEGEVVVLRARGASPRQALRFTYALLLPIAAYALVAGLAVAGVFWLSVKATSDFLLVTAMYENPPRMPLAPGPVTLIVAGVLVASYLALPYLVSWRVTRSRDIARLLREFRVGG